MINLIPAVARKRIIFEYWVRVVSAWLGILSGVFAIVAVLLIPIYTLVNSKIGVYEGPAAEARTAVSKFDLSSAPLVQASQRAALITNLRRQESFSALIDNIQSLATTTVTIENYGLTRTKESVNPIKVTGVADNRQALASFREALRNEPNIKTVDLPISNLAQDKDIEFTLTITLQDPTTQTL